MDEQAVEEVCDANLLRCAKILIGSVREILAWNFFIMDRSTPTSCASLVLAVFFYCFASTHNLRRNIAPPK